MDSLFRGNDKICKFIFRNGTTYTSTGYDHSYVVEEYIGIFGDVLHLVGTTPFAFLLRPDVDRDYEVQASEKAATWPQGKAGLKALLAQNDKSGFRVPPSHKATEDRQVRNDPAPRWVRGKHNASRSTVK